MVEVSEEPFEEANSMSSPDKNSSVNNNSTIGPERSSVMSLEEIAKKKKKNQKKRDKLRQKKKEQKLASKEGAVNQEENKQDNVEEDNEENESE